MSYEFYTTFTNKHHIDTLLKSFELFNELFTRTNLYISSNSLTLNSVDDKNSIFIDFSIKLEEEPKENIIICINTEYFYNILKLINLKTISSLDIYKNKNENLLNICITDISSKKIKANIELFDTLYSRIPEFDKEDNIITLDSKNLNNIIDNFNKIKNTSSGICSIKIENKKIKFKSLGKCSVSQELETDLIHNFNGSYSLNHLLNLHKICSLFKEIKIYTYNSGLLNFFFEENGIQFKMYVSPMIN